MFTLGFLLAALAAPVRIAPGAPRVEFKQPQLALAPGLVALTFGAGDAIDFALSRDGGRTFSKPVQVAEDGKLSLGRHRGPRIAITPGAIVVSAVVGRKGGGADGDLVAWRSTDGGKTWSGGVRINDFPASAREGLHAMAAGGPGLLFAAWLDSRYQGNRIYGALSRDGGRTWSANRLVYASPDGHTCECCHPSLAIDGAGRIYVMWRNWLNGARDMYLSRSSDGGETFSPIEKLGRGTWPLDGCPMDGGGLALNDRGELVTVWRRDAGVFLARPGKPELKLGAGKDPAVALGPDGVYAAWFTPNGLEAKLPDRPQPLLLAQDGAYVQLACSGGPVLAVWESKGAILVQPLSGPRP